MDTALLNVFMDTYAEKKGYYVVPILYISSTDNSCCIWYVSISTSICICSILVLFLYLVYYI